MSLKQLSNAAAAAVLLAGLAAPQLVQAQTAPATAKTQAAASRATGKATTDAPATSQQQGTAWAVKQAAAPPATAPAGPAAANAGPKVVAQGDLVETMRGSGQFKTFLKAADATNLTGVLKNNQNLTVFAPTDAAFAALPPGELDKMMADKAGLQKLLTRHIINARVDSSKIKGAKGPVPSVAGTPIELDGTGDTLRADNAAIVQPDVIASNGVLQVVDHVLMPNAAAAGGSAQPAAATAAQPPAAPAETKSTTTTTSTTTGTR